MARTIGITKSGRMYEKGVSYPPEMYARWMESYQEYVSIHRRAPSLREFQRTHSISQFVTKKYLLM